MTGLTIFLSSYVITRKIAAVYLQCWSMILFKKLIFSPVKSRNNHFSSRYTLLPWFIVLHVFSLLIWSNTIFFYPSLDAIPISYCIKMFYLIILAVVIIISYQVALYTKTESNNSQHKKKNRKTYIVTIRTQIKNISRTYIDFLKTERFIIVIFITGVGLFDFQCKELSWNVFHLYTCGDNVSSRFFRWLTKYTYLIPIRQTNLTVFKKKNLKTKHVGRGKKHYKSYTWKRAPLKISHPGPRVNPPLTAARRFRRTIPFPVLCRGCPSVRRLDVARGVRLENRTASGERVAEPIISGGNGALPSRNTRESTDSYFAYILYGTLEKHSRGVYCVCLYNIPRGVRDFPEKSISARHPSDAFSAYIHT